MKKHSALSLIFSFVVFSTDAQVTFERTIGGDSGEVGNQIIQTSDKGFFICAGTLSFGAGGFENYFIRTDSVGNISWKKTIGGSDTEVPLDVMQTADGGFITGGITSSFGAGSFDIFLIKMHANGDIAWMKTYGGSNEDRIGSLNQTFDGGFIVTGYSSSFSLSDQVYLLRLDSSGNVLWEKTYEGSNDVKGVVCFQTSDDGFIIAGTSYSIQSLYDACLIKTDGNGNLQWSKSYGGNEWDETNGLQSAYDGGYIISGVTYSLSPDLAAGFLIRTDSNGDTIWTHIYNAREKDYVSGMTRSASGDIVLAGYTMDSNFTSPDACLLMSIDSMGNPKWAKSYGGSGMEIFQAICSTTDGGFAMTGYSKSFNSARERVYFIKTDANGNSFCNDIMENIVAGNMPITISVAATTEATVSGIVGNPSFTMSSGGIDSTLCSSIGIEEIVSGIVMNVYPNPATDQIKINYTGTEAKKIEVFNLLGEKLFSTNRDLVPSDPGKQITVNCEHWPSGIYFITLQTENGIAVQKLIKQ